MKTIQPSRSFFDFSNVRDLLAIFFKHKGKALVAFVVLFIAVIVVCFYPNPIYESRSLLLVRFGREFLQKPEVGTGGYSVPGSIITAEMNIIKSQDVINKALKSLGVYTIYPHLRNIAPGHIPVEQTAARLLYKNLKVTNNDNIIVVSFAHSDPLIATKVVNTLVDLFKEKHLQVFSVDTTEFLQSQRSAYQNKLRDSEERLSNFKQRNQIYSFEDQRTALIQQHMAVDTSIRAAQNQISELQQKLALMQSPKWTPEASEETKVDLSLLRQREREALQRYTEGSRHVQNIRQEIKAARTAVANNTEERRAIEVNRIEDEISLARARLQNLRGQLSQITSAVRTLDLHGQELQGIKRETDGYAQNYLNYAAKLEDVRIMDDMDRRKMVAISVVEKAFPSRFPVNEKSDKIKFVAAGFFGSIAAGFGLAFLLEFMSATMTTPLSAERLLSLPVMVSIALKK